MAGGITQAEYWNGEVGTRWARNQAVLDAMFVPLTEALFAPLALRGPLTILEPQGVRKSYPSYWRELAKVGLA